MRFVYGVLAYNCAHTQKKKKKTSKPAKTAKSFSTI